MLLLPSCWLITFQLKWYLTCSSNAQIWPIKVGGVDWSMNQVASVNPSATCYVKQVKVMSKIEVVMLILVATFMIVPSITVEGNQLSSMNIWNQPQLGKCTTNPQVQYPLIMRARLQLKSVSICKLIFQSNLQMWCVVRFANSLEN